MASLEGIEAGALLGTYRVVERLDSGERVFFHATVDGTDTSVCLLELRADEVDALSKTTKLRHAHLAEVREVLQHEGIPLLVFEHVPGDTLTARLRDVGKKTQVEAVGSALRVSDALSNLHEAGGVHGFIHTDSVVLDPPERLGPVLSFAPVPSDERTFHSPERGESGKPSVADDAWATAGLLHMMLTGEPPPKDGYGTDEELEAAGVEDAALRAALLHGLNKDHATRSRDVRPLKRELARWFVEHAGEEPVLVGPHSTHPPPLPVGAGSLMPARVTASGRPPRRRRKPPFAVVAVMGTLVGLGAAWGYSAYRTKPLVQLVEKPASPSLVATANAIDLSEVPVTGEEETDVTLDKAASCVSGYLPKGAFRKSPDLAWLCEETDAFKGAQKLRVAVVTAAPKGGPTDAMKVFSRLGWYDMAAYAVIRAGCCEDPKPLRMPAPGQGCEAMDAPLRDLGKEVVAGKSYDEPLKRFSAAVVCETNLGNGQTFGRTQRPLPAEEPAFRELVDAIQR